MKKTIYFHIGTHKTGTTSLQSFCCDNLEAFSKNGLLYPQLEGKYSDTHTINGEVFFKDIWKFRIENNFGALRVGKKEKEVKKNHAKIWDKMKKVINKSDASKIVISCEAMSLCDFVLWEFLDHSEFNIKLVVYLRNPFDYLISFYKQARKYVLDEPYDGLYSVSLINHLRNFNYNDIFDVIEKYSNHLGKENVIIRAYEKESLKNGSIIDDFFDAIDYQLPENLKEPIYHNPSFDHDTTVITWFMRAFLSSIFYRIDGSLTHNLFMGNIGTQKTRNLVPNEIIKEVCDKYYERECQIAKKFLGRDELFKNRYPSCYYDKTPKPISKGIMVSYEQLDVLYKTLGEAFTAKTKVMKPIIHFLAIFIPNPSKRKEFRAKYLGRADHYLYKNISFADLYKFE